ncbi:unnamed protein product [Rodentolepis nana]|uniref:Transcription factor Dp-1 n=1 Tax=Rodentolepis nana TaxID=102285 RepID=A0A158QHC4_RODNA|nr:unnamed protein product [Rodentolepis nana]
MDIKSGSFSGSGDYFDIPAAEQEVTVDSNDQPNTSTIGASLVQNISTVRNDAILQPVGQQVFRLPNTPQRSRVIMLQRTNQGQIVGAPQPQSQQTGQEIRGIRYVTLPGAGGKQIKAAVIPKHMLQRGLRFVTSSGQQTLTPGGTVVVNNQPGTPGTPRILTLRPATQIGGQTGPGVTFLSPAGGGQIRPRTIIVSNACGQARVTQGFSLNQQLSQQEEMENSYIHQGPEGYVQQGYLDLSATAAAAHPGHFGRQASPGGHEGEGEEDHVNTGLKTNGLRRYARCVCNKVKEKGVTSYGEVADELVHEYAAEHPMIPSEQLHYIQKNIRRRVYDALNVLMALNVLQKEKKEIRWMGLPVNMIEECRRLEDEREKRQNSLRNKTAEIQELILQLIAFKNLISRNRLTENMRREQQQHQTGTGNQKSSNNLDENVAALIPQRLDRIPLPFLVVSTNRKAAIDCNISKAKLEYFFNFDQPFEVRDEVDTLKRMGLTLRLGSPQCTQEEYNQCLELIPPSLRFYVEGKSFQINIKPVAFSPFSLQENPKRCLPIFNSLSKLYSSSYFIAPFLAIYERRQAIVPDFDALHQQRRLFVEARLAEVSGTGGEEDPNSNSHGAGSGGDHRRYGDDEFFGGESEGQPTSEQIHLTRGGGTDITPGDTQHYARAAASRGFVVPGGPGGLLRHSANSIHRQAVKMTVESALAESAAAENASAAAAISAAGDGRLFEVGEDESDVDMVEEDEEIDNESINDDVDMVEVERHVKAQVMIEYRKIYYFRKHSEILEGPSEKSGMKESRIPCKYGTECYRINPDHFRRYSHPSISQNCNSGSLGSNSVVDCESDYGFYLHRVSGLKYGSIPTITLSEILNEKNGELQESAQFNYMFEVDWMIQQYPPKYRSLPLLIVHGYGDRQSRELGQKAFKMCNLTVVEAPIPFAYGTHHTKMMLLKYDDGMRVVIHTANQIQSDWHLRTQGQVIWLSPKLTPGNKDSKTNFRADLIQYLEAYDSRQLDHWLDIIKNHDFSSIKVWLIASVPGRHKGNRMNLFGHLKLASIYPSVKTVRESLEGYGAGECLPYCSNIATRQPWLRYFLHDWVGCNPGVSRAIPHIKSYCRCSPDGKSVAWFLLSSANLSKAAWGCYQVNKSQLMIRSYELGVLFTPETNENTVGQRF